MAVMPPRSVKGPMGSGLTFTKMTDLGIGSGFDLTYKVTDATAQVFLYVGDEENRVLVTGTTPSSRQAKVLAAIDQFGVWGGKIQLWMETEKNGTVTARTAAIDYSTHVKPFVGKLKISHIAADRPAMTYPGNGKARLLSKPINDRYYFIYAGKLETSNAMRGLDCTSFPMVLLSIKQLAAPGYGKQVCDACGAAKCDLEQVKGTVLAKKFKDDEIPNGLYILFSEGHVLLDNSDINTLYEFNYGGFRATPAAQRPLHAPRDLWWMRKLNESYRPLFA